MKRQEAWDLIHKDDNLAADIIVAASELMYHYFLAQSPAQQKCSVSVFEKFQELDKSLGTNYTRWQKDQ